VTLGALFDSFARSAFRYESRPFYDVGGEEADRLTAWRLGQPRPERSVRTSPWLARIATTTVAGKSWVRVSVLDDPPSEYQQFSLLAYVESQAAGDRMLVVLRRDLPVEVRDLPDFWLFDHETVSARGALMEYTAEGAFVGIELVGDDAGVRRLVEARAQLIKRARPLNAFLADRNRARA
jgi:hypothetical protein